MTVAEALEDAYQEYIALEAIYDHARERAQSSDHFARTIIPHAKRGKKTVPKRKIVNVYFDQLHENLSEQYALHLISIFEKIVFNKIDNAYGLIKNVVRNEYEKTQKHKNLSPLHRSAVAFIKKKEDIHNLSGARKLLEKQISKESSDNLKIVIEHRNWLSHGKRQDVGQKSTLTVYDIKEVLLKIMNEIG